MERKDYKTMTFKEFVTLLIDVGTDYIKKSANTNALYQELCADVKGIFFEFLHITLTKRQTISLVNKMYEAL